MYDGYLVSYAQNREDIILSGFFEKDEIGFYVDVGAYEPDYDSVTKYFYDMGWHGINIEPQPDKFGLFKEARPRDININAGVSNANETLKLRAYDNQGWSTFSPEMQRAYSHEVSDQTEHFRDIDVKVFTLKDIFLRNQVTHINFIKIDVEGLEYEVLEGNDWSKYRPEVICIEANHIMKDWRPILAKNKYEFVFFDGLNNYYTDGQNTKVRNFSYNHAVIMREPIINHNLLEYIEERNEAVVWLNKTNDDTKANLLGARAQISILRAELRNVQEELGEMTSEKYQRTSHLRVLLRAIDGYITRRLSGDNQFQPTPVNKQIVDNLTIHTVSSIDETNFSKFNRAVKKSTTLSIYTKLKLTGIRWLRRVLHEIRRLRS